MKIIIPRVGTAELGTKHHVLTDKKGVPLYAVVITSANTHDMKAAAEVKRKNQSRKGDIIQQEDGL